MHQEIYEKLKQIAKNQTIVFYSQIAPLANLDMERSDDRNKIAEILDEISHHEHSQGRPLLSAVVVHSHGQDGGGIPGLGFFKMAKALKLQGREDNVTFFAQELIKVHRTWL